MTIRHLEIFSEVCRKGSVTKAAEVLNMAQPAVSRAIRELEAYYETQLFERMNRKIYVTETGEELRMYANFILGQLEEARTVVRDWENMVKIRLGVNESCGRSVLSDWFAGFTKKHPDIPMSININNSKVIEEMLLYNELDIGLIDRPENTQSFHMKPLMEERMTAVCARDFDVPESVSPEELERVPMLMREQGSGLRTHVEQLFMSSGVRPEIKMESISMQSLIEACRNGLGVLFAPRITVSALLESGQLRELEVRTKMERRKYYLVYHKNKYLARSMKIFRDYLLAQD